MRNVRPAIIHCYRNWSAGPARRFAWGVTPPLVKYCTLRAREWPQSACQRKTLYCAVREELSSATWRTRRQIRSGDAPAAADIAFCVAAYANGMTKDRIERALEDDYLSRDPSISKRAACVRRTMKLPALVSTTAQGFRPLILS
jgi:hypothetical protein